jgi:hypothetical protein
MITEKEVCWDLKTAEDICMVLNIAVLRIRDPVPLPLVPGTGIRDG